MAQINHRLIWSSYEGCMGDVLASRGDEGRGRLRKARGRCQTTVNPGMSEWGNPLEQGNLTLSLSAECIGWQS